MFSHSRGQSGPQRHPGEEHGRDSMIEQMETSFRDGYVPLPSRYQDETLPRHSPGYDADALFRDDWRHTQRDDSTSPPQDSNDLRGSCGNSRSPLDSPLRHGEHNHHGTCRPQSSLPRRRTSGVRRDMRPREGLLGGIARTCGDSPSHTLYDITRYRSPARSSSESSRSRSISHSRSGSRRESRSAIPQRYRSASRLSVRVASPVWPSHDDGLEQADAALAARLQSWNLGDNYPTASSRPLNLTTSRSPSPHRGRVSSPLHHHRSPSPGQPPSPAPSSSPRNYSYLSRSNAPSPPSRSHSSTSIRSISPSSPERGYGYPLYSTEGAKLNHSPLPSPRRSVTPSPPASGSTGSLWEPHPSQSVHDSSAINVLDIPAQLAEKDTEGSASTTALQTPVKVEDIIQSFHPERACDHNGLQTALFHLERLSSEARRRPESMEQFIYAIVNAPSTSLAPFVLFHLRVYFDDPDDLVKLFFPADSNAFPTSAAYRLLCALRDFFLIVVPSYDTPREFSQLHLRVSTASAVLSELPKLLHSPHSAAAHYGSTKSPIFNDEEGEEEEDFGMRVKFKRKKQRGGKNGASGKGHRRTVTQVVQI
ncbi:hypothetical protein FRB95_008542 [Tulasnella sp. JGI-2019a]|nr:hypothetical protein FRB95_008542 [Tulasnella sp. JGI-2019a]